MPDRRDQHHRGRKPRHARAVTIVRAGYHGADERVAEHGKRDRSGKQGEIVEPPAKHAMAEQDRGQQHRRQRDGNVKPVDRGEVEMPALLLRRAHRLHLCGKKALDDAVGMAEPDTDAFAGSDLHQLLRRPGQCRLGLPGRIFGQRMQYDKAHLVAQSLKAAERVEHAVAP